MQALPLDPKWGLPVPYFVQWLDNQPEFRIADGAAWLKCIQREVCWLCGQELGIYRAFAIGPMCSINRLSADPPGHRECMEYGIKACPFLSNPKFERREKDRPPQYAQTAVAGFAITRNPGVTLLWVTRKDQYRLISDGRNGVLFRLTGEPTFLAWFAQGRSATRAEIDESIHTGLPILLAQAQRDGPEAVQLLYQQQTRALKYLPA